MRTRHTDAKSMLHSDGLKVGHLNVFHLTNKIHDISVFLNQNGHFHLFGLTETRLKDSIQDNFVSLPDYSVSRRDAAYPQHTGMAVYIHDSVRHMVMRRHDLESDHVESMCFEVKSGLSASVLICFIYRNPAANSVWMDRFVFMMDAIQNQQKNVYLLGDFNINLLNKNNVAWESMLALFGLKQLVSTATRVSPSTSTLIDHIYTSSPETVCNVTVPTLSLSDHYPIFCTLALKVPKEKKNRHTSIMYRSFKKFDKNDFLNDLSQAPFDHVCNFHDPEHAMSWWCNIFVSIL
jgi:hypothetical protein